MLSVYSKSHNDRKMPILCLQPYSQTKVACSFYSCNTWPCKYLLPLPLSACSTAFLLILSLIFLLICIPVYMVTFYLLQLTTTAYLDDVDFLQILFTNGSSCKSGTSGKLSIHSAVLHALTRPVQINFLFLHVLVLGWNT